MKRSLGFVLLLTITSGFGSIVPAPRAQASPTAEFRGVTIDGKVIADLFPIRATGVSTEPVRIAAESFLASLNETQRKETKFPVDDQEWRLWSNTHRFRRQGVSFKEMDPRQRKLAYGLLRASLSAKGFETSQNIMRLNEHLAELLQNHEEYGEFLYWITVMGEPSMREPWGWQLDGHHLVVNYFVIGDQVVMTPTFMGSEPIEAKSGRYAGTIILQEEQEKGLRLVNSLSAVQKKKAIIRFEKDGDDNHAEFFRDNLVLPYAGIQVSDMDGKQQGMLLDLIHEHVRNMDDQHAKVRMAEIRSHLGETRFAWIGGTGPESVFYYRIQNPVILIEFDHRRPIALGGPRVPGRNHIHTVVRTPNGNDYGKSLLRQHIEAHKNDPEHRH